MRRRSFVLAAAPLLAGTLRAGATSPPPEEPGTIKKVGDFGFGIVPDRDPGTRYQPDKLAEEFRKDGLRVMFSGTETAAPDGVRMWGTPFKLLTIRRLE